MLKRVLSLALASVMVVAAFAGCSNNKNASTDNRTYLKEAPMLTDQVNAGSLPKVEDRLPKASDVMVEQTDNIGTYGGTWTNTWKGIDDKWGPGMITEEALFRFKADGSGVEPNVAKSYEVNDSSTVYTIHLREGMKWSDGTPFTADDVMFYWEHMLLKETFGKKLYDCYYSTDPTTGEKAKAVFAKVDDYTFTVTHKYSDPLFLERVAIDNKWLFAPAAFYKKILPEFIGPDAAAAEATKRGFKDVNALGSWTGYYYWLWPDRPTLRAWVASNDPVSNDTFVMKRNPYFWKTDSKNQQLPYIDELDFVRVEDDSHTLLKALAGELPCLKFGFDNFTTLKENESKGGYTVSTLSTPSWTGYGITLNYTIADPKLNAVFNNIKFRQALSIAVDRNEISEIVTNGIAAPAQAAPPKELFGYIDGWEKKWTDYDVAGAKKLLDEVGLKVGADGFRTFSDGSAFELNISNVTNPGDAQTKFLELLKKYFEAAGIKTNVKYLDKAYENDQRYANQIQVATNLNPGLINVSLRPDTIVPLRRGMNCFNDFSYYRETKGASGTKPTGDAAKLLENWDKLGASTTTSDINKYGKAIYQLWYDNMWAIGYTAPTPSVLVVSNKMKNVPTSFTDCDEFRGLGVARPSQFYLEK